MSPLRGLTLRERRPSFAAMAAAIADWFLLMGAALLVAPEHTLNSRSYWVLADAVHYLTFGAFGDSTPAGMHVIGGAMLPVGVFLRAAMRYDRSPDLRWFEWAWTLATVVAGTWALGFLGSLLVQDGTGVTGPVTYLLLLRMMWVGMRVPITMPEIACPDPGTESNDDGGR